MAPAHICTKKTQRDASSQFTNPLDVYIKPLVGSTDSTPGSQACVCVPAADCALTEQGDCHQEPDGEDRSSLGRQEASKSHSLES